MIIDYWIQDFLIPKARNLKAYKLPLENCIKYLKKNSTLSFRTGTQTGTLPVCFIKLQILHKNEKIKYQQTEFGNM